jgi:hypothetical protein
MIHHRTDQHGPEGEWTMESKKKNSKPTLAMVMQEEIDRERELASAQGLATRPVESLRVTKKFAPLRTQPWQLALAIELVWFARSTDSTAQQWPMDKLDAKMRSSPTPIPADLSIQGAVARVLDVIEECDPKWFRINVAEPLTKRAVGGSWIPVDLSGTSEEAEHYLGLGLRDSCESAAADLQIATLTADLKAIAEKLEARAELVAPIAQRGSKRAQTEGGGDAAYQDHVCRAVALLARASLAEVLTRGVQWEDTQIQGTDLLTTIARRVAPVLAASEDGDQFRRDIAAMFRHLVLSED